MTPHELINLPYAGMAKKELIAQGRWNHTLTDEERIDWLAENAREMRRSAHSQEWKFEIVPDDYDPDFFREDIDNAASAQEATT